MIDNIRPNPSWTSFEKSPFFHKEKMSSVQKTFLGWGASFSELVQPVVPTKVHLQKKRSGKSVATAVTAVTASTSGSGSGSGTTELNVHKVLNMNKKLSSSPPSPSPSLERKTSEASSWSWLEKKQNVFVPKKNVDDDTNTFDGEDTVYSESSFSPSAPVSSKPRIRSSSGAFHTCNSTLPPIDFEGVKEFAASSAKNAQNAWKHLQGIFSQMVDAIDAIDVSGEAHLHQRVKPTQSVSIISPSPHGRRRSSSSRQSPARLDPTCLADALTEEEIVFESANGATAEDLRSRADDMSSITDPAYWTPKPIPHAYQLQAACQQQTTTTTTMTAPITKPLLLVAPYDEAGDGDEEEECIEFEVESIEFADDDDMLDHHVDARLLLQTKKVSSSSQASEKKQLAARSRTSSPCCVSHASTTSIHQDASSTGGTLRMTTPTRVQLVWGSHVPKPCQTAKAQPVIQQASPPRLPLPRSWHSDSC